MCGCREREAEKDVDQLQALRGGIQGLKNNSF